MGLVGGVKSDVVYERSLTGIHKSDYNNIHIQLTLVINITVAKKVILTLCSKMFYLKWIVELHRHNELKAVTKHFFDNIFVMFLLNKKL